MPDEQERHRQEQERYRVERDNLVQGEYDYSKSYDKYVLTLSGGALALSITYIHEIIGDRDPSASVLVVLAWICFTASVGAALTSIHQTPELYRKYRDIMEKHLQKRQERVDPWEAIRKDQDEYPGNKRMIRLNYASLVLFLLGVIFLLWFTGCNLKGTNVMSKDGIEKYGSRPPKAQISVEPQHVTQGATPPLAPVYVAPPSNPAPAPAPSQPAASQPPASQPPPGK
jgi:hypothetical protein